MRKNTIKLFQAINKRFDFLYKEERIRYDDVIKMLCTEFFRDTQTIQRALRTKLLTEEAESVGQSTLFAESSTPS